VYDLFPWDCIQNLGVEEKEFVEENVEDIVTPRIDAEIPFVEKRRRPTKTLNFKTDVGISPLV